MKAFLSIVLLMFAFWVVKSVFETFKPPDERKAEAAKIAQEAPPPASALPGLPPPLEASLSAAEKQGVNALGEWLNRNRIYIRDPRLADIELNYVVLISHQNPAEAKRIFLSVKSRTPTFSPVYDRVKRLERTFQ